MKKILSGAVLTFVPFLTTCRGPKNTGVYGWDQHQTGNYRWWEGHGGDVLMGVLFLIVLAATINFIVRYVRSISAAGRLRETPVDVLRKCYANGDLSKDDFERLKNDLQ